MRAGTRRAGTLGLLVALLIATAAFAGPAAAQSIPFQNWTVKGSLKLKKLNQSTTFPAGSVFNGSADLATGDLTGHVTVPTFKARLTVFGIPADATLELVEASPVSGKVVLGSPNITVTGSSSFIIRIRRLASPYLPLNLVASRCQTADPVTLPLNYTGPLDLVNGFRFTGTTTIPRLTGCGLSTPLLTTLMSGPGNPFDVSIAPPS